MDPLLKGANKKEGGKTVGVKLNENDLAILNLRLRNDSFDSFSEFVHAYIDRTYPKYEKEEQAEKLLERIRDKEIKDPLSGDFSVDFYKSIDKEDILKDLYRKYIYKKHARDLVRYFERYSEIFFTKPHLIQSETGHVRAWICDSMRRFSEYYDRKYQNPEVRLLIDEIIKRYELNKNLRIHDRVWLADDCLMKIL